MMKFSVVRKTSLVLISGSLLNLAQMARAQEVPLPVVNTAPAAYQPQAIEVSTTLTLGIGSFQDVQVPMDSDSGWRVDGTSAPGSGETHVGVPVTAAFGLTVNRALSRITFGLDLTRMESATGTTEARAASWSRIDLSTGWTRNFVFLDQDVDAGVRAGLRRSSWMNVSTGHFMDALLTRAFVGIGTLSDARIEFFAAAAPVARFGYNKGEAFAGGALTGATARTFEGGASLSMRVFAATWLEGSVETDRTNIQIKDLTAYNAFGLNVAEWDNDSKSFALQTTMLRVGLRRAF